MKFKLNFFQNAALLCPASASECWSSFSYWTYHTKSILSVQFGFLQYLFPSALSPPLRHLKWLALLKIAVKARLPKDFTNFQSTLENMKHLASLSFALLLIQIHPLIRYFINALTVRLLFLGKSRRVFDYSCNLNYFRNQLKIAFKFSKLNWRSLLASSRHFPVLTRVFFH